MKISCLIESNIVITIEDPKLLELDKKNTIPNYSYQGNSYNR